MRQAIDLSGKWQFQPDPASEGVFRGYFRPGHDSRRWREVSVPASFEMCMPALDAYEGEAWFRRTFPAPADWRGRRVALRFAGVNYHASVWVNGQHVGDHRDGFLPFEFAVQDWVRWGEENTVIVRADNLRRQGEVPGLQRGWRTFGGILREVELIATDKLHLDHVNIVAEPRGGGGDIALRIVVKNDHAEAAGVSVAVRVKQNECELAGFVSLPQTCVGGESVHISLGGAVPGARPWSPDQPHLYTACVSLLSGGRLVDEQSLRIGFRRIEARDSRVYLNGEPVYFTGFNRHEDSPRTNMCPDVETTRQDLLDMKAAGANFVRLCHYPHHTSELDLCDELGLMVMGEIPLFWWDGLAEGEENYAHKVAAAERQLTAMIRRDTNHPSVVLWSVSNETHEQRPEVMEANAKLVRLARSLDPSRLATHASNHWREGEAARHDAQFEADHADAHPANGNGASDPVILDAQFEHNDVICVNAYPSLNPRGYGGVHGYDFAESTLYWREQLAKLHEKYPQKPIMVSEFGYASLRGVFDCDFGEDTQAEAISREFAGMDAPYVCGAVVWCWADHPRSATGFCRSLSISPYGVLTRERQKLKAYWTIRKLFLEKRSAVQSSAPLVNPAVLAR